MKRYVAKYNPILNKGVYGISLVENPAMEGTFIALKEQDKLIQFKTLDNEKRIVCGLVLEPNKPIYRNQDGEEFTIEFSEDTIEELCYGFTKNKHNSNSTIEHEGGSIKGVTFVENWIVRDEKIDTSVALGFSAKKGSWVSVSKIDSDEIWNDYVKTGKVLGFSIDAMLSLEEVNLKSNIMNKDEEVTLLSLLRDLPNQIKLAMTPKQKEVDVKFGAIKVADGSVTIEYEGEMLQKDVACWISAEDGTKVPVPVGDYELEDGTVLSVVQEGVVGEVGAPKEAEPTEPTVQEPQAMADEASKDANIAKEIESAIKSIMIKYSEQSAKVEELEKKLIELGKEPASKPINSKPTEVQLNKGKFSDLLNKINNN